MCPPRTGPAALRRLKEARLRCRAWRAGHAAKPAVKPAVNRRASRRIHAVEVPRRLDSSPDAAAAARATSGADGCVPHKQTQRRRSQGHLHRALALPRRTAPTPSSFSHPPLSISLLRCCSRRQFLSAPHSPRPPPSQSPARETPRVACLLSDQATPATTSTHHLTRSSFR